MNYIGFFIFFLFIDSCFGKIFHLNATEYARMPPLFALDEHEACLSRDSGIYCLLSLDLYDDGPNPVMDIIHGYSEVRERHYNYTYIERGVCVHKTCQTYINGRNEDLGSALEACLNDTIWRDYGVQVKLAEIYYCDSRDEEIDLDYWDWIMTGICICIVSLNFVGTTYDYIISRKTDKGVRQGNKVILSFSIRLNWRWLMSAEPEDKKVRRLGGMHGVRSFCNVCIVLAHVMWIIAVGFTGKPHDFERGYETPQIQLIVNGLMIVQVFFTMSGFLLVYNFKLQEEKHKLSWMQIPLVVFIRWWRLSATLGVVLVFTNSWMRHLGSGPLWKHYVTNSVVADCRTYWWHHLLYINNYVPDDKYCMLQTWHIGADTQLFLLGIATYIGTATHPRARWSLLACLLGAGVLLPALHVLYQDMDGIIIMEPEYEFFRTMNSDTFHHLHVLGHNNISCFVIGMLTSEWLYHKQRGGGDGGIAGNKIVKLGATLATPAVILLMYSGSMFYLDGERASLAVRMVFAAVHRPIVGLITAFGLFTIIIKVPSPVCKMYEWRGWVVPSRLSYAIYLIHFNLIYIYMGTRTELGQTTFFYLILCHIAFMGLSFIFALPLFLFVEAPMNRLLKTLISFLRKSTQGEPLQDTKRHRPPAEIEN